MRARLGSWASPVGAAVALVAVVALVWGSYRVGGGGGPPPDAALPRVGSAGDPSVSSSSSAPAGGGVVVAHVAGAVIQPGLYTLAAGARVADAIAAAGGAASDADVDAVNLAAPVEDGEGVYVPRKGETPPGAVASPGMGVAAAVTVLDLNKATAGELDALPGVGPSTAAAIVAYRSEHGRFRSVDQLLEVRGIGPAKLAALRSKVRVR